jgi:hypothetical protein
MYAMLVLVVGLGSGLKYLTLVGAGFVLAAVLGGVAVGLWVVARKLASGVSKWTWTVLAIELVFTPLGSILFGFATNQQPEDNPFAEGGNGVITLLGSIMAACGGLAVVLLILECGVTLGRQMARLRR